MNINGVKLNKVANGEWEVLNNGVKIGDCISSNAYHGSYEAKLSNGIKINAFNKKSLVRMIEENI